MSMSRFMSNIEREVDLMLRTWSVMFRFSFVKQNIFKLSECFQKETLSKNRLFDYF